MIQQLDITIPEFPGSHPFSRGKSPVFYREHELGDTAEGATRRTDFFEKILAGLYWKLRGDVPYAFKVPSGEVRSMDAGCMKFLHNRQPPEIEFITNNQGYMIGARPSQYLIDKLTPLKAQLIARVSLDAPSLLDELPFDISAMSDERVRKESLQVIRNGQAEFRKAIQRNWRRCAITGSRVGAVVEAAHILRYLGPKTNDERNGIALRSDVHVLFDRDLIALKYVDSNLFIVVSSSLVSTEYGKYAGKRVALPADERLRPDQAAVAMRLVQFELKERRRGIGSLAPKSQDSLSD